MDSATHHSLNRQMKLGVSKSDMFVPERQRRSLFRTEYEDTILRANLGTVLARHPVSQEIEIPAR